MELAIKYQLYLPLMKSERGGEEAEKAASSLEFQCYISLPKHTQELSGEGWRPDTLILQNPRLDGVSTASKAPGGPGAPQTVLGPRSGHGSWYHKLSGIKHRRSRERTPGPWEFWCGRYERGLHGGSEYLLGQAACAT